MEDAALTVEEAAEMLRVDAASVRRAIAAGSIPGILVGGEWRVLRSDVESCLREGLYHEAEG